MVDDEQLRAAVVGDLGEHNAPITLCAPDPSWTKHYVIERRHIEAALGGSVVRIEHVGSTSVPDLIAKPIIDVSLEVPDSTDEAAYVPQLESAGFALYLREPAWFEHRLLKGTRCEVNLHVFTVGAEEPERMIRFRNRLRAHPEDRELYARTKIALARERYRYVQHYADAKSDVVAQIMARALAEPVS